MPPMTMPMYFTTHWQHQHVLFSFWEIKTVPGYCASLVAVAVVAALLYGLDSIQAGLDRGLARPIGAGAASGSAE